MATKIVEKKSNIELEKNSTNSSSKKKRDISIDLIRIFACLSVIATHLCLQVLNQCYNRIDWSRLLEKSFITDGVPLFFMITGFFLVNGRSYKKIWIGTIKKILIPAFIFVLFTQVFFAFIVNQQSFMYCIQNFDLGLPQIIQSILTGDIKYLNSTCAHLWYIYSYVKIVIWIPVLWLMCKENNEAKLARRIVMTITIINTVLIDIQKFFTFPLVKDFTLLNMIPRELLYVLLGYELFVHKVKIKNNKYVCIFSLLGYFLINFVRYKIEMQYMVNNYLTDIVGRANFMEWRYTCLSIFSGLCVFMFLYSFEINNEKISKILVWISDKTFEIYLIHYLILAKLTYINLKR